MHISRPETSRFQHTNWLVSLRLLGAQALNTACSLRLSTAWNRAPQLLAGGSSGAASSEGCQSERVTLHPSHNYTPMAFVSEVDSSRKRLSLQPPPAGSSVLIPRVCGVSKDGNPHCPLNLHNRIAPGAAFRTRCFFSNSVAQTITLSAFLPLLALVTPGTFFAYCHYTFRSGLVYVLLIFWVWTSGSLVCSFPRSLQGHLSSKSLEGVILPLWFCVSSFP